MFISKNNLLTKKVNWKNISVKIFDWKINQKNISDLSEKECEKIFSSEIFLNFKEKIYNKEVLEKIIFSSRIYFNSLEWLVSFNKNYVFEKNFIKKFVYESNRAEWSKIKESEVFKIFENKKINHWNKNEIQEVENSIEVFNFMNEKFIFNIWNIKKAYHILTKNLVQESWGFYPRWFKKFENTVNNDETSKPENVEKDMENLIIWYKENKGKIFPLELAFKFHLKFQKIHPFIDWNWRVWRFLINKILISNWYFPLIIFSDNKKSFFDSIKNWEKNQKKYYKVLLDQYKKTLEYFDIYSK